jgi:hypothetical protein
MDPAEVRVRAEAAFIALSIFFLSAFSYHSYSTSLFLFRNAALSSVNLVEIS